MAVQIDLTTLSGYESLPAGTYALGVKAKASGYTDSDLSSTVSFTKLAAPVVTAADTTVSWDAITNATSYDVYVDGELYENTTGGAIVKGYTVTITYSSLNPNVCFYSTDNGSTWIDGYVAGQSQLVLNNVEQIKFKGQYSSSGDNYAFISVPSLNVSIYATSATGAQYSDNFVLTQNLTDVTFASGSD